MKEILHEDLVVARSVCNIFCLRLNMPIIERYSAIKNGGIVFTGNTLGLSKAANAGLARRVRLHRCLHQPGYFPSSVYFPRRDDARLYQKRFRRRFKSSRGSTVLYAELVWGGLFRSSANNISALLDNPVEFITPSAATALLPTFPRNKTSISPKRG